MRDDCVALGTIYVASAAAACEDSVTAPPTTHTRPGFQPGTTGVVISVIVSTETVGPYRKDPASIEGPRDPAEMAGGALNI